MATVKELRKEASDLKIAGASKLSKEKLETAIEAKRKAIAEKVAEKAAAKVIPEKTASPEPSKDGGALVKVVADSLALATASEVDENRAVLVRQAISDARFKIDEGFFEMAALLNETYHQRYFENWGYGNFRDYVEDDLGIKYRRAKYYVEVASLIASHDIGIAQAKAIGWSKLKELPLVLESKNKKEWLKKAERMTVKELREAVLAKIAGRGKQPGKSETVRIAVVVDLADGNIITEAIERGQQVGGLGNTGEALSFVCGQWLETLGDSKLDLSDWIAYIQNVYGVEIVVKGDSSDQEASEVAVDAGEDVSGGTESGEESGEGSGEEVPEDAELEEMLGLT
jgi:hypothetical protein